MSETFYYKSPLGYLQIVASKNSITGVTFMSKDYELLHKDSKYKSTSSAALEKCINELDAYFSGKNLQFSVPFRQEGTAFQQNVWESLLSIPAGQTSSYMALSKKLGNAKAIRAVGTANGKNKLALLVPCHRVIGSNGTMVGYAGEVWRKQWLLQHEAKHCNGVRELF